MKKKIMETNNFKLISEKLNFNSRDEFYFLQILQRPKDGCNVGGSNKNRLIKYYLIKSKESLLQYQKEIIGLCNLYNARAYIHPTKRSFKEVSRKYCLNVTENVVNEHYHLSGKEFSTACGQVWLSSDKKYIVDLDNVDGDMVDGTDTCSIILYIEEQCNPIDKGNKLEYIVPTASGMHLICKPFDTAKFSKEYPSIDIHKNNPTLLYFNKK